VRVADVSRAESAVARSALAAAVRGWHVFPCVPGGKRPALRGNWQDLATTSPDQVRDWWARAPYNIGIACGPSGLVVIDLDLPDEPAEDDEVEGGALFPLSGADRLSRLARQRGERYPAGTYVVDTPSGADGGYVVGAGSRIGGQEYAARSAGRPPAPLPSWLGQLVAQSRAADVPDVPAQRLPVADRAQGRAYAMAALRAQTERVASARPGTRNDTLNRAAFSLGQLVAAGLLPPLPVITGLISAARHAGLPEEEAVRTVRSGMAGGSRKPRTW
jgi:hypothetical protein